MANLITNNITADSKRNAEIFANAIQGANTLKNDYLNVIARVKNEKVKLNKFTSGAGLSQEDDRDCAWDPTTGITLGEKEVDMVNLKVNAEQCIDELDSLFSQDQYSAVKRGEMPADFETFMLNRISRGVGLDIEKYIWSAAVASGDPVDGIAVQAAADAATVKVNGTTLTASNVLGEIEKVYAAIPDAVLDVQDEDPEAGKVRVFVSPKTYRFVLQALSTTPTGVNVTLPNWTIENGVINYLDVEIAKAQGMADDTMFAAAKSNLVFATNLLEDAEIRGSKGASLKDENVYYIKAQYRMAATYVFSNEVVIYE